MASTTLPLAAEEKLSQLVPSSAIDAVALAAVTVGSILYLFRNKIWRDPYHHLWFDRPHLLEENCSAATPRSTRDVSQVIEELVSLQLLIYSSLDHTAR